MTDDTSTTLLTISAEDDDSEQAALLAGILPNEPGQPEEPPAEPSPALEQPKLGSPDFIAALYEKYRKPPPGGWNPDGLTPSSLSERKLPKTPEDWLKVRRGIFRLWEWSDDLFDPADQPYAELIRQEATRNLF